MRDLFGDVVITSDDIDAWVAAVAPAFMSSERAFFRYVTQYHVVDKIRFAKLSGTFDTTIENARDRRAYLLRQLGLTS